jgi:hypothetical protein
MGKPIYYKGIKLGPMGLPAFLFEGRKIKPGKRKRNFYITFPSPFGDKVPKNLIVMYDIPHEKKKERDWFRRQLVSFGYEMIQKSVWVGPSPLPKEFMDYIKFIGLKSGLKTFKLAKPYNPRGKGNK